MANSLNIFDALPRDCWVEIDTAQLTENMRLLIKAAGVPALAVVKANGYGHGYANAARAFVKGGAKYLGVANLAEGLVLRQEQRWNDALAAFQQELAIDPDNRNAAIHVADLRARLKK